MLTGRALPAHLPARRARGASLRDRTVCDHYCASVTDSIPLQRLATEKPPRRVGKRGSYLPSAQVLEELARLGPGLSTLAEELRARLSEPADELRH